ncbi:MAG: TIGR02147 family protein [Bdellovibrionota bacterium]
MASVYECENYRIFLKKSLETDSAHGAQSRLARAAGCSPSWITRVLNGAVQLTPDQAFAVAQHFGLAERESDYFLLLVDQERAATPALRKRLERRASELKAESARLSANLRSDFSISESHRLRYYSSWIYPSVHVACMIKPLAPEEISALVGLARESVAAALSELAEIGLVQKVGARWEATTKNIHLPSDHLLTNVMHSNWRVRTTQLLQEKGSGDGLHYSGVHCLSRKDIEEIKGRLKAALVDVRKQIEASPSEAVAIFCMDWYIPG